MVETMLDGTFGQGARNAASSEVGVGGHVGDQVQPLAVMAEWHQAGVADDAIVFLPDVARQRQGCALGHLGGPMQEALVASRAAHILHVALTVAVHRAGEAQLDQVCHMRQVA